MLILKYIREGERVPNGYGIAWLQMDYCRSVAAPVPLNWILGCARRAYFWMAYRYNTGKFEKKLRAAYLKGRRDSRDEWIEKRLEKQAYSAGHTEGYRKGHDDGCQALMRQLQDDLDRYIVAHREHEEQN